MGVRDFSVLMEVNMAFTLYIKRSNSSITEEELLSVKSVTKEQGKPMEIKNPVTGMTMTAFSGSQIFWNVSEEIRIPLKYKKKGFISVDCRRDDAPDVLRPLAEALDAQIFDEEDNIC